MTEKDEYLPVHRFVVVTTEKSPLRPSIELLRDSLIEQHPDLSDPGLQYLYTNEILSEQSDTEARKRYEHFVRCMVQSQLVIIDLHHGDASHYILGIRQALSNETTIALVHDDSTPRFADSRFATLGAPSGASIISPFHCLDVSESDWLCLALNMTKGLGDPRTDHWVNDLQSVNAYQVKPLERSFETAGLHDRVWQLFADDGTSLTPEIAIMKGDIRGAKQFDVWVNSENTYMEMARLWDRSVSAVIRKLGAVRQPPYHIYRMMDAQGLALAEKMGTKTVVDLGTVFLTQVDPSSDLSKKHNAKCVAHVAAVEPNQTGYGFKSGNQTEKCIKNVFAALVDYQGIGKKPPARGKIPHLKSVLFPLFGAGDGGAHSALVAHQIAYTLHKLLTEAGKDSSLSRLNLDRIGLIAYQQSDFDFIVRELESIGFQAKPESES